MSRLWNFCVAQSQAMNALLLAGSPDETVSGRAFREDWRLRRVIDALFFWEAAHCAKSHRSDVAAAHAIIANRKDLS